jgi:hypothetical protein
MLKLPPRLYEDIVQFLLAYPNIHDRQIRNALLGSASLEPKLAAKIEREGTAEAFVHALIDTLCDYGTMEDGRHGLEAVLTAAKQSVGSDRQAYSIQLLQDVHTVLQATTEELAARPPLSQAEIATFLYATEEQEADLTCKLELLRQQRKQADLIRQTAGRKSVGTKPIVEKFFVDREAYLAQLLNAVCQPETRLILIVGQGGIGKTALAAKFCDDVEKAGYALSSGITPNVTRSHAPRGNAVAGRSASDAAERQIQHSDAERRNESLTEPMPVRAIVYLSKNEMAAFTLEQVFDRLLQVLTPEEQAEVSPTLRDPQLEAALQTERLMAYFQDQTVLLVLDNFESTLDDTACAGVCLWADPGSPHPRLLSHRARGVCSFRRSAWERHFRTLCVPCRRAAVFTFRRGASERVGRGLGAHGAARPCRRLLRRTQKAGTGVEITGRPTPTYRRNPAAYPGQGV